MSLKTILADDVAGTTALSSAQGARTRYVARVAALVLTLVVSSLGVGNRANASSHPVSTVTAFAAPFLGAPPATAPAVVGIAAARGHGYYVLRADGTVLAYGAPYYGSINPALVHAGVSATGIALDPASGGYWVVLSSGIVRGFHAPYQGEAYIRAGGWGQYPAAVAICAGLDGRGYYVLRANGGVNSFGVRSHGSLAGHLHYGATAPVVAVGIALDSRTGGYWIATSNGNVTAFNAPLHGSPLTTAHGGGRSLATTGIAADLGGGYYVLGADGSVDNFAAPSRGSLATPGALPVGAYASGLAVDPATGGYYESLDLAPLGGYRNPFRAVAALVPQEIDQGVDYCGSGPVYAIGEGVIENVYDAGWPSGVFIAYRLNNGSARGLVVFVAENVTPTVTVGQRVSPTTQLGVLHDAKTCLETGWANAAMPAGHAAGHAQYNGKNSTAYGLNFSDFLQVLGVRPGLPQSYGPPGTLPPTWPTW